MKFFHLSDLHIGKHLFYYSLLEDQKYVFHQILEAAKEEQPVPFCYVAIFMIKRFRLQRRSVCLTGF